MLKENANVIRELMNSIKKYYPINTCIKNEDYPGDQLLDKIVADKIDSFTSDNLPKECYDLVNEINANFGAFTLHVRYYNFFPSYVITIELADKAVDCVRRVSWLNVKISMLTNYFTVYFEDQNWFNNLSDFKGSFKPIYFGVLSTRNTFYDPDEHLFNNLKNITLSYFPEYKHVSHKLLLDTKIDNRTPLGKYKDIIEPHSIYSFLFDNDYQLPTTIVVE